MEKILSKVYSEKDLPTNFAIFTGALSFLFVYTYFGNDPYLALVALLSTFSFTKIVTILLVNRYHTIKEFNQGIKSYSETEQKVISIFVKNGTCFLSIKDMEEGKYGVVDSEGIDSLVMRGAIEFIDGSFNFQPTGFQLNEKIYTFFLEQNAIQNLKKNCS